MALWRVGKEGRNEMRLWREESSNEWKEKHNEGNDKWVGAVSPASALSGVSGVSGVSGMSGMSGVSGASGVSGMVSKWRKGENNVSVWGL